MMTVGSMIVSDGRGFAAFNEASCKAVRVRHERKHGYNNGSPRPPAKHSTTIAQFLLWWGDSGAWVLADSWFFRGVGTGGQHWRRHG